MIMFHFLETHVVKLHCTSITIFYCVQTWEDPRLTWKPSDYGGIEYIYTKQDKIWRPELIVDNS